MSREKGKLREGDRYPFEGELLTVRELAINRGINANTLRYRLDQKNTGSAALDVHLVLLMPDPTPKTSGLKDYDLDHIHRLNKLWRPSAVFA